ncbi:MAG: protein-disulfide reductase DsbD family protein [Ignavibacterium album]|jgi:thiol:disulfide interchange protein DsbD|uniref:protein-disulfide reductase DsbD domain-containing protein n=1 Tax=Ignavibacterium album TaxID=591197 RepID=UPI0026F15D42|nr:protein-disulfide reductase DsbD domain-containing protein [Ignavibacterium album]MCX8106209.1 protein-disulfide reductase DsbD family protein [Ignavibacterium album]
MKKVLFYFIVVLQFSVRLSAQSVTGEAKADIILDSFDIEKDSVIQAGILVTLENGWHIYWRNSGDSGMPTTFEFNVPDGIKVIEIQWPVPKIFEFEGYASYGYEDKVLFPFKLILSKENYDKPFLINVKLKSLICKDVCKPYNDELKKEIDLNQSIVSSSDINEIFKQTFENLPEENKIFSISAKDFSDKILLTLNSDRINFSKLSNVHFIPYENGISKNSLNQKFTRNKNSIELSVEYDQFRTKTPESIEGLLILNILTEEGMRQIGYEIKQKLEVINQTNK